MSRVSIYLKGVARILQLSNCVDHTIKTLAPKSVPGKMSLVYHPSAPLWTIFAVDKGGPIQSTLATFY